jgi:hypothetical protein
VVKATAGGSEDGNVGMGQAKNNWEKLTLTIRRN